MIILLKCDENIIFLISGDNCIARHQTNECNKISDRFDCLTSFEERNEEDAHQGSECVWCQDGVCPSKKESQCESKTAISKIAPPKNFTRFGFEDCLKLPSKY